MGPGLPYFDGCEFEPSAIFEVKETADTAAHDCQIWVVPTLGFWHLGDHSRSDRRWFCWGLWHADPRSDRPG